MNSIGTAMEFIGTIPIFRIFNIHVIFLYFIYFLSIETIFVNIYQMTLFWKLIFLKVLKSVSLSSEYLASSLSLLDNSSINSQFLMFYS